MTFAFSEEENKYIYYDEEGELCIHFLCPTEVKNSIFKKIKIMEEKQAEIGYNLDEFF